MTKNVVRKRKIILLITIILLFAVSDLRADNIWKNWYGIAWRETVDQTLSLRYAKSMGYDAIAIGTNYATSTYNVADANNLKFYITDPYNYFQPPFGGTTTGHFLTGSPTAYNQGQIDFYEKYMAWGSSTGFPGNIATRGAASATEAIPAFDFQQQAVIDYVIASNLAIFAKYEIPARNFTFGGWMNDAPIITGDFYYWNGSNQVRTNINRWTGTNSCLLHGTITHEFATYADGLAAYFKQLRAAVLAQWPNAKWIVEPSRIWSNTGHEEWVNAVSSRDDSSQLIPDMLTQESSGVNFQDSNIYNSGMAIDYTMVGSSQPNDFNESDNRLNAVACGTMGAWYNWFGRFGGTGNMPNFQSITEVSPRLKLIRCIPNWDNIILDGLPTATTRFAGNDNVTASYYSVDTNEGSRTNSYISNKIYWGRDHRNSDRTIYACFLANSNMGTVTFPASDGIVRVWSVNNYFEKDADITSQFTLTNNVLQPISTFQVDTGSGTGVIIETGQKGRMYCEY